ncbi:MAG: 2-C-methyl-D-erythritol 4-phosphate cytidylyltransferase [Dehalococcoidia bacterium]|nr:2-C-methyl-D-erythritol 4-phosphate cytidylyltransferase [Dehalococcoidia bacterium]
MKKPISKVCAIIVAAGASRRMNGVDKVFAPLGGKPVLAWSVSAFQQCPSVDQIIIVVSRGNLEKARQLVIRNMWTKVTQVCAGGKRRQDSVTAGLAEIVDCEWVIVHDGARPFVTAEMLEQGLKTAKETGAAVAAVPVTDTIKVAGEDMLVRETPSRNSLWAAQTPQVFRHDIITEAYRRATGDVTDDASLVEQAGYRVKLYTGSYDNIKITTPGDLVLAEVLSNKYAG